MLPASIDNNASLNNTGTKEKGEETFNFFELFLSMLPAEPLVLGQESTYAPSRTPTSPCLGGV